MRRIPILATIIVIAAALAMVGLGVWQLNRAEEKNALLDHYASVGEIIEPVPFPLTGDGADVLYRRSSLSCDKPGPIEASAGTSERGAKGWAQKTICASTDGTGSALIYLGWSRAPTSPQWNGGEVTGIIAPGPRLVLDPPAAGLQKLAKPDPADLPNNHLAYAGQWFFFALTALAIYTLALRRRLKDEGET